MKKIHMAIIDDEIQSNYVDNYKIKKIYLGSERTSGEAGPFSHSTICFLIFQEYVSVQVEYSNICILDQTERASIDHMIKALIWCEKNNVDLINLSLGSVKRADGLALRKIVNRLAAKGVIFVCSADNDNYITYPACFSNVIILYGHNAAAFRSLYGRPLQLFHFYFRLLTFVLQKSL